MERAEQIIRKILLFCMFVVLFFPMAQSNLHLFMVKDLKGSFKVAPDIEFNVTYWFNGIFQENKERYLNENFGLRNTAVRINNQIRFELFEKTGNIETVIGKDRQLFAKAYIESYTGENFVGAEKIIAKCKVIKQLQEKMIQAGKIFLPVLAPNKARILNDYLPEEVVKKGMTNYDAMVLCFKKLNVNYIDFNDYFLKNYKSSPYPLFSKYGVHWSSYGHTLAADSIIRYINNTYHLKTPQLVWKNNIYLSDELRELDYDTGDGMNLFVDQLPSQKMAYIHYEYSDRDQEKPPLLVVADSYNYGLKFTGMGKEAFSNYKFLYYFKELMTYGDEKQDFYQLSLKEEIENHKVFLMIATEHNLINFGWGFAEKSLNILNGKSDDILDKEAKELRSMELAIRNDTARYKDVIHQAFISHRNIDTLVLEAARSAINLNLRRKEGNTPLMEMIDKINSDPQWMKDVRVRAMKKNISVDSAIVVDALWQLENKR